jgi:probable rRNA maturation factor
VTARAGRGAPRTRPSRLTVDVGRAGARGGLTDAAVRRVARLVLRAEGVRAARVSVALVSDAVITRVNAAYLGRRRVTDVIAFTLAPDGRAVVGDVYIAPDAARRSAAARGIRLREEMVRLVVHGVLHVLGHDHPDGAGRTTSAMWRRQEALVLRALRSRSW